MEKRVFERKIAKLQEQLAEALKAGAPCAANGSQQEEAMETESADADCVVLDAAVLRARDMLNKVKGMAEDLRGLVAGGYSACLAQHQAALDRAQAARRAANPIKKQLETAEAHKERAAKKLADVQATLLSRKAEMEALTKQIELDTSCVTEAEAAAAHATAEVASLAAQFAQERSTGSSAAASPAANAEDKPAPGFVSIAFAEEKWAEREAAFAQQLAQVQALVSAQPDAQSEAGDFDPPEQLEDDEAWSKVDRGKRQKLLRRERDVLATNVRSKLGKVSAASSPFKKA